MSAWRDVYHAEVERQVDVLRRARDLGQTWLMLGGRQVDPTRMGPRRMLAVARREAERMINYAINVENEGKRRDGKPDDVAVDEIWTGRRGCLITGVRRAA